MHLRSGNVLQLLATSWPSHCFDVLRPEHFQWRIRNLPYPADVYSVSVLSRATCRCRAQWHCTPHQCTLCSSTSFKTSRFTASFTVELCLPLIIILLLNDVYCHVYCASNEFTLYFDAVSQVDHEKQEIVVRTSNKKYYKRTAFAMGFHGFLV